MCGIIGIFAFANPQKRWLKEDLDIMLEAIKHRGPDGSGEHIEPGFFLGHTRLAVIDLSSTGHQPMFSKDKRYIISFNGEIYNFREIREELINLGHKFVSCSDTEVLLSAWQEWGEVCLDKLDGIFAFAIFDRREKNLFLVRDHLGVKPLFYMINKDQIFFASELLALFGCLNPCPDTDAEDLDMYFTFNYLPAPRTGLKDVYQLQPGCILKVNSAGIHLHSYWRLKDQVGLEPWSRKKIEQFKELLLNSVNCQMVSDAPLGLFLSGGLDSYAVALSAGLSGQKPNTFTLGFDDYNFSEVPTASVYAKYLHLSNEISMFSWTEADIYNNLNVMNELLADASCFPVYQLSRFARKKAVVVLSGDGGDELLAGYDTYKAGELMPFIRMIPRSFRRIIKTITNYLPSDNRRYGWRMVIERLLAAAEENRGRDHASFRRIFDNDIKKRLYCPDFFNKIKYCDPIEEYAGLMKEIPSTRSYLTARQYADIIFHLPSILSKVDRMSMANGLEVRVPLLSKKMVEFCINIPDELKRYRGKGKRILREAIFDKIPVEALNLPKAGFLPPVDKWFRNSGPMINIFGDYLNIAKSSLGWLKWDEVERLWDEHKKHKIEAGFILLGILQFINWSLKCRK
ncbi:MAG: asparagine synthase (glutamine-hydrolyzing) [Candidatus Omnitrophota bacterium]